MVEGQIVRSEWKLGHSCVKLTNGKLGHSCVSNRLTKGITFSESQVIDHVIDIISMIMLCI